MVRTMQRSSAHSAMFGNRSVISSPDLPRGLEAQGEPRSLRLFSAVLPSRWYSASLGLGSNESTWDMPPERYIKMTCLAVPGKCGALGASGFSADGPDSLARRSVRRAGKRLEPRRRLRRDWRRVML